MTILINAYCTVVRLPSIDFPCQVHGIRDLSDSELASHLDGLSGYILSQKGQEMTQSTYYTLKHVERVKNHVSIELEDRDIDLFSDWAISSNAICFLPDGTIRNPSGEVIIPEERESNEIVLPPYLNSATIRKEKISAKLLASGVNIPSSLPPVIDELEFLPRSPIDCAKRILGIFVASLKALSLTAGEHIDVNELKFKYAFEYLTDKERVFMNTQSPSQQDIINFAWKNECVYILLWCLGDRDDLNRPTEICDVKSIANYLSNLNHLDFVERSKLRSSSELLDELDFTYRLQWLSHHSRSNNISMPNQLNTGVIQERMYALNWLTRFYNAEWDDIDTPA
jgi:Domain of unknown function (DUF4272)